MRALHRRVAARVASELAGRYRTLSYAPSTLGTHGSARWRMTVRVAPTARSRSRPAPPSGWPGRRFRMPLGAVVGRAGGLPGWVANVASEPYPGGDFVFAPGRLVTRAATTAPAATIDAGRRLAPATSRRRRPRQPGGPARTARAGQACVPATSLGAEIRYCQRTDYMGQIVELRPALRRTASSPGEAPPVDAPGLLSVCSVVERRGPLQAGAAPSSA